MTIIDTNIMADNDIIISFVSERDMGGGRESCLINALQSARILCGKNKDTGESISYSSTNLIPDKNLLNKTGYFIGLINYLLILDMLGIIFTNEKNKVGERIDEVLKQFSNIADEDRKAIYSLRNALTHDCGLVHRKIKFILDTFSNKMVKQPIISWDGSYSTKNNDETSTRINPLMLMDKLIDKIEEIIRETMKRLNEGTLKCELDV
jgi:hypothetical protein